MIKYINQIILNESQKIKYIVKDDAPNTFESLVNTPSLVVWSGESHNTIFQDKTVNWAFRALHDTVHLATRIGFAPEEEVRLAKIQANKYSKNCQQLIADLIYIEVAEQAKYYKQFNQFLGDKQIQFTMKHLNKLGYVFN